MDLRYVIMGGKMKKVWISIVVAIIFLAGCMVRTYTVEKPRIDTDIEGNRGYLTGAPATEPPENKFGKTRKISVFEIEFPERGKARTAGSETAAPPEKETVSQQAEDLYTEYGSNEDVAYVEEITIEGPQQESEQYVVQKYDTLQKISYKFYGTTKKWKYLYNVNKNVIKNPDKLYPGMKLTIPYLD